MLMVCSNRRGVIDWLGSAIWCSTMMRCAARSRDLLGRTLAEDLNGRLQRFRGGSWRTHGGAGKSHLALGVLAVLALGLDSCTDTSSAFAPSKADDLRDTRLSGESLVSVWTGRAMQVDGCGLVQARKGFPY